MNHKNFWLLCLMVVSVHLSFAQTNGGSVARVTITAVSGRYVGKAFPPFFVDGNWRWKFFDAGGNATCVKANSTPYNEWVDLGKIPIITNQLLNITTGYNTSVEAWNEYSSFNCGWIDACGQGDCDYNGGCGCGDVAHYSRGSGSGPIIPANFPPGVNSTNYVTISYSINASSSYEIKYLVNYTPTSPGIAVLHNSVSYANEQLCDNDQITLQPSSIIDQYINQFQYVWEYNIDGISDVIWVDNPAYCGNEPNACSGTGPIAGIVKLVQRKSLFPSDIAIGNDPPCCTAEPFIQQTKVRWLPLGVSYGNASAGAFNFKVKDIPAMASLASNATIYLRAKIVVNGLNGAYSIDDSKAPTVTYLKVSPLPPSTSSITITPQSSCPGAANGKVNVSGVVSPFGNYRYILKFGYPTTLGCDPKTNGCLSPQDYSGVVSGDPSFEISSVKDGTYTLFLTNDGADKSVCPSAGVKVVVGVVPALAVTNQSDVNLICYSDTFDASFTISGGAPSALPTKTVDYNLYTGPNSVLASTQSSTTDGASVVFKSLSADSYKLVIDDHCTTPVIRNFSIVAPVKVDAAISVSNATCNNPGNGVLSVSASKSKNSSANFRFRVFKDGQLLLEKIQASSTWSASGMAVSDAYQVMVQEENSPDCNGATQSFKILAPPMLSIGSSSISNVHCYGGADGVITLNAIGGAGAGFYGYRLIRVSDGSISQNSSGYFSGLRSGDYNATILNSQNGCQDKFDAPSPFTVTQPDSISILLNSVPINCNGSQDGKIQSAASGGTPGYGYTWQFNTSSGWSSLPQTTPNISQLGPGSYRLKVTDSYACTNTSAPVVLTDPDPLTRKSVVVHDIACLGEAGTLDVTASGGTAPYSFAYKTVSSPVFLALTSTTPLAAANYQVRVVDSHGCAYTDPATYSITQPASALSTTATAKSYGAFQLSCFGSNDGEVLVTASGGNGGAYSGYQYQVDGSLFGNPNSFKNLSAGTHVFAARDARGCVSSQTLTLTQPVQLLVITSSKKDIACYGASTGEIDLAMNGNPGTVQYKLDTKVNSTGIFSALAAGTYSFVITDANNCSTTYQETIINLHDPIAISTSVSDVLCFGGSDGQVTLQLAGGVSPYITQSGNQTITSPWKNLSAGSYSITATDQLGCTNTATVDIHQPTVLTPGSVQVNDIKCLGDQGTIVVKNTTGGVAPYQFGYSTMAKPNPVSFDSTTLFSSGSYQITITDAHGCSTKVSSTADVTSPPAPLDFTMTLSNYNGYNISCAGGSNGYSLISATGGNGNKYSGYSVSLDGGAFSNSQKVDNINAGVHTFSVKDGRGCVVVKQQVFTQSSNQVLASVISKKDVVCFTDKNGEVSVGVTGGTAPYQYRVTDQPFQSDPVLRNLGVGNYIIQVMDANQCPAETQVSLVSINSAIKIDAAISDVSCFGGHDGQLNATVTGGTPPYTYQWTNNSSTSSQAVNLTTGKYSVHIVDQLTCAADANFVVGQPSKPVAVSLAQLPACWNQTNGAVIATADGGTPPFQFSLDGSSFTPSFNFPSGAGSHEVHVLDSKNCDGKASITVGQKNPAADLNFLVATHEHALDTLVLTDISVPKPDSISWSFDAQAKVISKTSSPEIIFSSEGDYSVSLTSYYGDCQYIIQKTISVKPYDPNAVPPKAGYRNIDKLSVSPNPSTGQFDLEVKLTNESAVSIKIYDILGVIQFHQSWDPSMKVHATIDFSTVTPGVYIVQAITDSDAQETRLVIAR